MQVFENNIFFLKIIKINERTKTAEAYEQTRNVYSKKNFVNLNTNKASVDWMKARWRIYKNHQLTDFEIQNLTWSLTSWDSLNSFYLLQ